MASSSATEPSSKMALPPGFKSIQEISNMDPNAVVKQRPFVNVIGLVRDYQPPKATGGTDWKMTLTIVDNSIEESYENHIMKVNIFSSPADMPVISAVAQPVLIRTCRVQVHSGAISLLTSYRTEIHVFSEKISPGQDLPLVVSRRGKVKPEEVQYVTWLQSHIAREAFPNSTEFMEKMAQATNARVKYCELKDAQPGRFCDLVGEVIHMFEASYDRVTVYLTDYTTNKNFYNNVIPGVDPISESRDGDDFGYSKPKLMQKKANEWPGPYGKMTVQLTAFDRHGERFKEYVKVGDWVKLSNVYFEFPKTGGCLEAKLRTDRHAHPDKLQVEILVQPEDKDAVDFRWKNALRRKRDYYATVKKQKRELEEEINDMSGKRKRGDTEPVKMNGKHRRKEKRREMAEKLKQKSKIDASEVKVLDDKPPENEPIVNTAVKCHKQSTLPIPLIQILNNKRRISVREDTGVQIYAPFVNANYRANIRVTDFFPHKLEDFSIGRKPNEFDCLSDNDATSDDEDEVNHVGKGIEDFVVNDSDNLQWTWRFALQVEDATSLQKATKERIWLLLDNESGQFLLSEDATNLRTTPDVLAAIREKLFVLWGDLEERKSAYLNSSEGKLLLKRSLESPKSSLDVSPAPTVYQQSRARPGEQPPDSDDDESTLGSGSRNPPTKQNPHSLENVNHANPKEAAAYLTAKLREIGDQVQNKPFAGCIREYGIKFKAEEELLDSESQNDETTQDQSQLTETTVRVTRWERLFGLFGTTIM